jgi:hypothetical protein
MGGHFQLYGILPILVTAAALALSFLVVFAGHNKDFMTDYAVMTLNTSRIGQNAVDKIDDKIMGFNVTRIIQKRDADPSPVILVAREAITGDPQAHHLEVRQLSGFVSDLADGAASLKSEAGGALTSVQSAIESKATAVASAVDSVEGLVASKISSAIASVQTAAVGFVNETYQDFLAEMDLQPFYSIHMLATCEGGYVTGDGKTNISIGASPAPTNGTRKVVDACHKHSSLNPLVVIRVLFEAAIFFTGLSFLLAIWATLRFTRGFAVLNVIASLPALALLVVASAATHVLAIGASAILNFFGQVVGVRVESGGKFMGLAWGATILMLANLCLWLVLVFAADKLPAGGGRDRKRGEMSEKNLPKHEMKSPHR